MVILLNSIFNFHMASWVDISWLFWNTLRTSPVYCFTPSQHYLNLATCQWKMSFEKRPKEREIACNLFIIPFAKFFLKDINNRLINASLQTSLQYLLLDLLCYRQRMSFKNQYISLLIMRRQIKGIVFSRWEFRL